MCSMRVKGGANSPSLKGSEPVDLTSLRAKGVKEASPSLADLSSAERHASTSQARLRPNPVDRIFGPRLSRNIKIEWEKNVCACHAGMREAVMLPDESFAVFHLALGSSNKDDNSMFDREIKMQIDRDEKSKSFESCRLRKSKLLKHLELGNSKSDRPSTDAVHCEECSQSAPSTRSKLMDHRRMYKA
ncbi:uncharacterized protein UHOD_06814 [Ustilago sp. UG-2017b]|nr:uncharacterized protein UHOD_06814 [Ustilago sp. UG-2017b]